MSPIGYWHVPLVGLLCLGGLAPAQALRPSLAEAVKKADSKYLNAPETGPVDKSPKIEVGGSEEGSRPGATEISSGLLRVTVTYVEEPQPGETQPLRTPVVTVHLNDANAKADKGQTEGVGARRRMRRLLRVRASSPSLKRQPPLRSAAQRADC